MLNYIKSQIAERVNQAEDTYYRENDDTSIVTECAHIFSELDDLSEKGTEAGKDRSVEMDIPLDDDLELENIELNITDGRITDEPMDATTQESAYVKTFADFYNESAHVIHRMPRETSDEYEARVNERAYVEQAKYDKIVESQKKLFGFGSKISINDDRVPTKLMVNFGPINDLDDSTSDYKVNLDVYFIVDDKHRIEKNQLKAYDCFKSYGVIKIAPTLRQYLTENYTKDVKEDLKDGAGIWTIVKPESVTVGKIENNKYKLYMEFKSDFTKVGELCFSLKVPVNSVNTYGKTDASVISDKKCDDITYMANDKVETSAKMKIMSKRKSIEEAATKLQNSHVRMPDRFSNHYYQEAIDFGDANSNDAAVNDDPTADVGDNADPTVSMDGIDTPDDKNKTDNVDDKTNDVSDKIAKKVDEKNKEDSPDTDELTDTPADIDDKSDIDTDDNTDDTNNVDDKLADLDSMGKTDLDENTDPTENDDNSINGDATTNFDDMTIDDLIAKGTDKLKDMTLAELKNFIGDASNETDENGIAQEGFDLSKIILTNHNINKTLRDQLQIVSGILNDTTLKFDELVNRFKLEGHKLNKILTKASGMSRVYNKNDVSVIEKLNTSLVKLIQSLRATPSANNATAIKVLIKTFVTDAKKVNDTIERVGV